MRKRRVGWIVLFGGILFLGIGLIVYSVCDSKEYFERKQEVITEPQPPTNST